GELCEVAVTSIARGEEREVVALDPRARGARRVVVDEVDLTADDRLDVVRLAGLVHLHRAVHDAVVRQPQGRLAELRGTLRERLDLARAVEQRVLGVHVEMGAGGIAHVDCMLGIRAAEPQRPRRCLRRIRQRPISDMLCLCAGGCSCGRTGGGRGPAGPSARARRRSTAAARASAISVPRPGGARPSAGAIDGPPGTGCGGITAGGLRAAEAIAALRRSTIPFISPTSPSIWRWPLRTSSSMASVRSRA